MPKHLKWTLCLLVPLFAACPGGYSWFPTRGENAGAGAPVAGTNAQAKDIVDTAIAAGSFQQLTAALTRTGLADALRAPGPFTVFAPTDDAFAALEGAQPGLLASLSDEQLSQILLYHVVNSALEAADVREGASAVTLAGSPVLFSLASGPAINGAKIIQTDIVAKNGIIHVIDAVITPPEKDIVATAVAAGSFTQLAALLTTAGLVDDLQSAGPFTVFAPTDAAFAELSAVPQGDALENVLLYHVVSGAIGSGDLSAGSVPTLSGENLTVDLTSGVKVNSASVTTANILTRNGIIHVIDKVLVPN